MLVLVRKDSEQLVLTGELTVVALGDGGCCLILVGATMATLEAVEVAPAGIFCCIAVADTICADDIDAIVDSARSRAPSSCVMASEQVRSRWLKTRHGGCGGEKQGQRQHAS